MWQGLWGRGHFQFFHALFTSVFWHSGEIDNNPLQINKNAIHKLSLIYWHCYFLVKTQDNLINCIRKMQNSQWYILLLIEKYQQFSIVDRKIKLQSRNLITSGFFTSLVWGPALGRLLVVPHLFYFRGMEAMCSWEPSMMQKIVKLIVLNLSQMDSNQGVATSQKWQTVIKVNGKWHKSHWCKIKVKVREVKMVTKKIYFMEEKWLPVEWMEG